MPLENASLLPAPPILPMIGTGETVLVLDDDDGVRRVVARILARHGFNVLESADCAGAVAIAEGLLGAVRLLVVDVVMPRMNGIEAARRLRKICPGLGAIFMSGYDKEEVAENGAPDPEMIFIAKPFTARDLLDTVGAALLRSRERR